MIPQTTGAWKMPRSFRDALDRALARASAAPFLRGSAAAGTGR